MRAEVKNITAAAAVGWRTVLVGKVDPVSGEAVPREGRLSKTAKC